MKAYKNVTLEEVKKQNENEKRKGIKQCDTGQEKKRKKTEREEREKMLEPATAGLLKHLKHKTQPCQTHNPAPSQQT